MTKKNSTLQKHVDETQMDLIRIKRRWFVLAAAEAELKELTKDKSFRIHNDVVWRMLLDSHDMLVIDLASFARGLIDAGGLIGQVKARCNELPKKRPAGDDDEGLHELLAEPHREAYERLFGTAVSRKGAASIPSVDEFAERIQALVSGLIDDRDRNRAHKFERADHKEAATILGITTLKRLFDELERIFNDVRLVCSSSTMAYSELNHYKASSAAPELIDIVLLGHAFPPGKRESRIAAYAALHEAHDVKSSDLFNDSACLHRVLGEDWRRMGKGPYLGNSTAKSVARS